MVAPGSQVPPPHIHTRNEECVYVLEGILRYSVDGVVRDLGEWMFTPRGSVHHFSNPHNGTARALRPSFTPEVAIPQKKRGEPGSSPRSYPGLYRGLQPQSSVIFPALTISA
ncbi:cupin domain-containing protein [Cupriavidus sp. SK-4]|uniref:cupin domain-containing protein n=1 Tax=Cupriavidus sp. SK-4 TaxID=574750 RepID=UPI001F3A0595|nr:cupin domain-containing protein [Cupriavidus sp. SK-4]